MATYNQERIIKEYWAKVKNNYTHLTFEEFEQVCKYPAIFAKEQIKSGKLLTIMIKNLGKFMVYPAKVKDEIKAQENFFKSGHITGEVLKERKDRLEEFLIRFKQEPNELNILEDDFEEGETLD